MTTNLQPNTDPTVLILCPTEPERLGFIEILKKADAKFRPPSRDMTGIEWWVHDNINYLVGESADGSRSEEGTKRLLILAQEHFLVKLVVLVGTCASTKDQFGIGAVMVPKRIMTSGTIRTGRVRDSKFLTPTGWLTNYAASSAVPAVKTSEDMYSSKVMCDNPEMKKVLVSEGCVGAEMEAEYVFKALTDLNYSEERLVVRSVMDHCDRQSIEAGAQDKAIIAASLATLQIVDFWGKYQDGRDVTVSTEGGDPEYTEMGEDVIEEPAATDNSPTDTEEIVGQVDAEGTLEVTADAQFRVTEQFKKTLAKFAEKHKNTSDEIRSSQNFWGELLNILGVRWTSDGTFETNPNGGSAKADRIDVFVPGCFIAEQKSRKVNDFKPVWDDQVALYVEDLGVEAPPIRIVCNFAKFEWEHVDGRKGKFPLEDLPKQTEFWKLVIDTHNSAKVDANRDALQLLAKVYDALIDARYNKGDIQTFLMRFLFCVFADDTGVWERGLFKTWLTDNTKNGASPKFNGLHAALNTNMALRKNRGMEGFDKFPYINGGLFKSVIEELTTRDRTATDALLAATRSDWSRIGPVIFGSMFQQITGNRNEMGKHYTSEEDILKVLKPLCVDEYEKKLEACRGDKSQLQKLQVELGTLQFFDQAAGCGNFLIVAYQELRRLETEILRQLWADKNRTLFSGDERKVFINQFFGIEYETFPAEIAKTGFYLADHLANMALVDAIGETFFEYPIQHTANIIGGQDSLTFDWVKFLEDAPTYKKENTLFIIGNPPYKGSLTLTQEQKDGLRTVWGEDFSGKLDYVTGWFKKTVELMKTRGPDVITKAGLVATSSITQGTQPVPLWSGLRKVDAGVGIDFAYQPFLWESDEDDPAGVSVVIIGFSINSDRSPNRRLWLRNGTETVTVQGVSPYLFDGPDTLFKPAKSKQPEWVQRFPLTLGSMPNDGGHLSNITTDQIATIRTDTTAARFIRECVGSYELINGKDRWCLWLKDSVLADRAGDVIADRVGKVAETRLRSSSSETRAAAVTSYLFSNDAQPTARYLAVPRVSSEGRNVIGMRYLGPDHIATDALYTISGCPTVLFGILQSQLFTVWQDHIGGRLRNDRRMSTYVYDSFPFLPLDELTGVEGPAVTLLEIQERLLASGITLAQIHKRGNTPEALITAHKTLDRAVDAAYGLRGTETGRAERRFETLAAAYHRMVSAGKLPLPDTPSKKISSTKNPGVTQGAFVGRTISPQRATPPSTGPVRQTNLKFSMLNLPVGSVLVSVFDPALTCVTVDNDNQVLYGNEVKSLSAAAVKASVDSGGPGYTRQGPACWKYNNKLLTDLREESEQPTHPAPTPVGSDSPSFDTNVSNEGATHIGAGAGLPVPVVTEPEVLLGGRGPRRANLQFSMLNLPVGSVLVSVFDPALTCVTVDNDNQVLYGNEVMSLSAAAVKASVDSGGPGYTRQGPACWKFNGLVLSELRDTLISPPNAGSPASQDSTLSAEPVESLDNQPSQEAIAGVYPSTTWKPRQKNFKFSMLNLPVGSVLVSVFDPALTCVTVDNDNQVLCGVTVFALSTAATRAAVRAGREGIPLQGAACWRYDGVLLSVLREQGWLYPAVTPVP